MDFCSYKAASVPGHSADPTPATVCVTTPQPGITARIFINFYRLEAIEAYRGMLVTVV